jgi:hypothetical protein
MPQRHRTELSESVSGERPVTYRRTARTFSAGRTCAVDDCPTVLSIYNSSKYCAAHNDHRLRARRPVLAPPPMMEPTSEPLATAVA